MTTTRTQLIDNSLHSMPQLPVDIFGPIFEHLVHDKRSLRTLSLSSHLCCQEAQRVLFRDVHPVDQIPHLKFLKAIIKSPSRLAPLVQSYFLRYSNFHDISVQDAEDLLVLLRDALKVMCNLRQLSLDLYDVPLTGSKAQMTWILLGCSFSLEQFEWVSRETPDFEEMFEKFLAGQRRLLDLNLCYSDSSSRPYPPYIPATFCPEVIALYATWGHAKALLGGHPKIETLEVIYVDKDNIIDNTNFDIQLPTFEHVKALSYPAPISETGSAPLDLILRHLPSVTVIRLGSIGEYKDFRFLKRVPYLHTLIVKERRLGAQMIRRIFDNANKNLQYIDLFQGIRYLRHTRSTPGVEVIGGSEVHDLWSTD